MDGGCSAAAGSGGEFEGVRSFAQQLKDVAADMLVESELTRMQLALPLTMIR
jgi:hypothetical protein